MKRISALICAICLTAASLHITALADNNAAAQAEADKGGYSAYIKKSNEYGLQSPAYMQTALRLF